MSHTQFGDLTLESFLSGYWQQRPLVVRGAFGPGDIPVDGARLLELSMREDADSRLIVDGDGPPDLYYGPFEEDDFADLGDEAWTVLVQEVDRLLPEGRRLMDRFRFLPNWRMDDLMVSYAMPGGGVGAHIDQYDVFLIQGQGRRRWQYGNVPLDAPSWREDSEVAILKAFKPDHEVVLETGDMLYLPPRVAHNGVALEPCITLSIGFRAPSRADLLTGVAGLASESFSDADRFEDPGSPFTDDPGRLDAGSLERLRAMVRESLADDNLLDEWLARIVTESPRGVLSLPESDWDHTALKRALDEGSHLRRCATSQLSYAEIGGRVLLSASGMSVEMGQFLEAAQVLTGLSRLDAKTVTPLLGVEETAEVVLWLINEGLLAVETD